MQGELIQAAIAQAVGTGLGLNVNWGAPVAYPVDSLRSASFTQKYGLASSVMGGVVINDVATADDVWKGVRLVNTNPGPYDELVIKYLYQPIYASSLQEEKQRWIAGSVNTQGILIMLISVVSPVLIQTRVILVEAWETII